VLPVVGAAPVTDALGRVTVCAVRSTTQFPMWYVAAGSGVRAGVVRPGCGRVVPAG
jgi:hypothetical protein